MSSRSWTERELLLLRVIYSSGYFTPDELVRLFPGRTLQAIRSKASRLGYHREAVDTPREDIFSRIERDPKVSLSYQGRRVVGVRDRTAQMRLDG